MDPKRKKIHESYAYDNFLKEKVGILLRTLKEVKDKEDTHLVRQIISDLDRSYNLYLYLPHEILASIFLYLTCKEVLDDRNIFLVCKVWTNEIANSEYFWVKALQMYFAIDVSHQRTNLPRIRKYCLFRGSIMFKKPDQKFPCAVTLYTDGPISSSFKNSSDKIIVVELKEEFNGSSITGIESISLTSEYCILLENLDFLRVNISSFSELIPNIGVGIRDGHNLTLFMDIVINDRILAKIQVTRIRYKIEIYREVFQFLHSKNYLEYIITNKLVPLPTTTTRIDIPNPNGEEQEQITTVSYKGDLGIIARKKNPLFTKVMIYIHSFFEIILAMKEVRTKEPWEIWGYLDKYIQTDKDFVFPSDISIKTKKNSETISLEQFGMDEKKFFEN